MPQGASTGFQIPGGLGGQMNQGILADLQRRLGGGMNPMALMQMMNMGQGMMQQPQQPLPQAYRAPIMPVQPYQPRRSLFSAG